MVNSWPFMIKVHTDATDDTDLNRSLTDKLL